MEPPPTQYTAGRDPAIAYQVVGDGGGVDLVAVGPLLSHVEHSWSDPRFARSLGRLAAFGRHIRFDRRGVGMSDASPDPYTIADEVDDMIAVMDAAEVERAAVVSWVSGGPVAILLAALHPDRVSSLVLDTCVPRTTWAPDYDWPMTPQERAALYAEIRPVWGSGDFIALTSPDWAQMPGAREWMGQMERMASGPASMVRLNAYMDATDVRAALPSIQAPTLVVRRVGDDRLDRRHALHIVESVEGAILAELPGRDSTPWGPGIDEWIDRVGRFVVGSPPPAPPTRGLATLLFTDIVDSTVTLAKIGDTRWREVLERHDRAAHAAVDGAGGRLVKSLGDGVFARFDKVPDAVAAARDLSVRTAELGVAIRAGVHIGDCELVGEDLAGRTVHEAARISALAGPGELLVSDAAHGLLAGAGIETADRGFHTLKGFDETYRLWAVE